MTGEPSGKMGAGFWILSGLALIWNLMGVVAFVGQVSMSPELIAALPDAERSLHENFPAWALVAFACAVFGGAIGCILLLRRMRWAQPVLAVSLAGIIVQLIHSFFISGNIAVYGPGAMIMPIMILVIGVALVWWATKLKAAGVLN